MSLPFALNHINLWLLRDSMDGVQGWSIVDCCIHRDEAKAQWESVFAHELEGLPILRVIVTHMHPDHIGLAHWLCERWSVGGRVCRLWNHRLMWLSAKGSDIRIHLTPGATSSVAPEGGRASPCG